MPDPIFKNLLQTIPDAIAENLLQKFLSQSTLLTMPKIHFVTMDSTWTVGGVTPTYSFVLSIASHID